MKKYVIGVIEKANEQVGLRVLETDFKEKVSIKDFALSKIAGQKYENVEVDGKGKIKSLNGAITRYAIIDKDKNKIVKNALVVLCRTLMGRKKGFVVVDVNGKIAFLSETEAVKEAEKMTTKLKNNEDTGIANGKLVEKDGNKFISAIRGDYETIENVGIIKAEKSDKEWDLSRANETHTLANHIEAIRSKRKLVGVIGKSQSLEILSMFQSPEIEEYVQKEDIGKLCKVLTKRYEELKDIIEHCELKDDITNFVISVAKDGKANADFFKQCNKAKTVGSALKNVF